MSRFPIVSVVIPAYNHEAYIGEAIDSVLAQSMEDWELIIIDDGSTDGTKDVVMSYDDPRISYTWQENQDAYNTINRGMSEATGHYISILNSDDVYTPNRLEMLLDFAGYKNASCVFSDVIPISDKSKVFEDPEFGWNQWHAKNRKVYFDYNRDNYVGFLHGNYMVTTSNLFMTREAMQTVGKFANLRYLHDYDYIFRMMLAFPDGVHYLDDEKLLYYRIHPGNTLSEAAIIGRQQDLQVIEQYMLAKLPETFRNYVQVGSQRLRVLENELNQVRQELRQAGANAPMPGANKGLMKRIWRKMKQFSV